MIDFHTHFLPGIDDGSRSVDMSIAMLHMEQEQGVTDIVATPHFYASKVSPDQFLRRRERAWQLLKAQMPEHMPRIHFGAEVYYFGGMSRSEELHGLCIEGTNVLLLEMPFHEWPSSVVREVADLAADPDYTIVMAHIDRYLKTTDTATWQYLAENGAKFQMNADFIAGGWLQRRQAVRLIGDGTIRVIASDCHNTDSRKPNLADAARIIEKKLGEEELTRLTENAEKLLRGSRTE